MGPKSLHRSRGFSLVELVIVVVIIAIIGAIAVPRLGRGAKGAADAALIGDLAVLRNAVELYAAEHGGTFPAIATIDNKLTLFSDDAGTTATSKSTTAIYGPYIRKVPALKVGAKKGSTGFTATAGTAGKGWVYDEATGALSTNTTTEADEKGVLYNTY